MEPFSEKPIQIYEPQFIRILSLVFDQTLARNITHLALSKFVDDYSVIILTAIAIPSFELLYAI